MTLNAGSITESLSSLPWNRVAEGMRDKSVVLGAQRFRLVEFSDGFEEPDWCHKQHAGYVLEGEMTVNVDGTNVTFKTGDAVFLPKGVPHRHDTASCVTTLFLIEPLSK